MDRIQLAANRREQKGGLAALRRSGIIPAILYGKKRQPEKIQVACKNLEKAVATEAGINAIFDLTVDGKNEGVVRIREFQAHPLSRNFIHVDFQAVDLKEKIEVEVPIQIVGKAEGVKLGGVLEQQRRALLLKCLVTNIPDTISVDVSALQIGQSIHADEIQLPEGVEFPHETNFTIVGCVPPAKEEEAKPAEAEAAPAAASEAAGSAAAPAAAGAEAKEAGKKEPEKKAEKK